MLSCDLHRESKHDCIRYSGRHNPLIHKIKLNKTSEKSQTYVYIYIYMCMYIHIYVCKMHTYIYIRWRATEGTHCLSLTTCCIHICVPCVLVKIAVAVIWHHDRKQSSVGSPGSRHLLNHTLRLSPFPTLYRRESPPMGTFYRLPQPLEHGRP